MKLKDRNTLYVDLILLPSLTQDKECAAIYKRCLSLRQLRFGIECNYTILFDSNSADFCSRTHWWELA